MEVIDFRTFIRGHTSKPREVKLHSFTFNPLMLVDPVMVTFGSVVIAIVVTERILVVMGHEEIAEAISLTLKMALPFVAAGVIVFFLASNPILSWL